MYPEQKYCGPASFESSQLTNAVCAAVLLEMSTYHAVSISSYSVLAIASNDIIAY